MATAGDSSPASTAAPAPEKINGEKAGGEKPIGDGVTTKQFGDAATATPEGSDDQLERSFSFLSSFGQAFAMLNSWTAASASLSLVLDSGGPVAMLWGLVISAIGSMCMVLSLAEICHVYPVQGGQYDWTYILAPPSMKKSLSFIVGWLSCAGWTALVATGSSLGGQFVIGIIGLLHDNYVTQNWHEFLVYVIFTIGAFALNTFGVRLLPAVDAAALYWSLVGIVVVSITILACASPNYQSGSFVFGNLTNQTGWPNGVAFILGMLQANFSLTGFDAISHMVEEMPNPAMNAPKVMCLAVLLGSTTTWVFMVCILFVIADADLVSTASSGPLLQIYYQATNNLAGAVCLVMFNLVAMAFATQGLMTVASRMTRAFARDRGFGALSNKLQHINPRFKVPAWALVWVSAWTIIFGCIYLGSTAALNAILSSSVFFLQISYMVPIALVLFRGRSILDQPGLPPRRLQLGAAGPFINGFALVFALVTSVFFTFPPDVPVTDPSAMNYVVVLGVVALLAAGTWIFDGRKRFVGPSNLQHLLAMASKADNGGIDVTAEAKEEGPL